jgi:DNA-binding transcriptional LysR family regulator
MPLDLKLVHLRALETVGRLHSYALAAEELSYTEPAVLLQIRALEKALGLTLVRRERKRVALTDAGEQIARAAIDALDRATRLQQVARGLKGRIVVGAGPVAAVTWVMPLIARYQELNPAHAVDLHTDAAAGLVAGVADGLFDVAIGGLPGGDARGSRFDTHGLVLAPWVHDEWWLFAPGPIAHGSTGPVFDIKRLGEPARVFRHRSASWPADELAAFLRDRLGTPVEIVLEDNPDLVRGAVVNGLGFGILPYSVMHVTAARQLVPLFGMGPWRPLTLWLLHRRARLLTSTARSFLRFLIADSRESRRRSASHLERLSAAGQERAVSR